MDKIIIEKQAKNILDRFAKSLEKVDKEKILEPWVERDIFTRDETNGSNSLEGFKKRFLDNAPRHDDEFIICEKGDWK
ncbi:MAG: hypothetical protein QXW97_02405 [Candidatus Pacearchaeota archaeon]